MDYSYEQALEDARFFEKNINLCTEFEDSYLDEPLRDVLRRWKKFISRD